MEFSVIKNDKTTIKDELVLCVITVMFIALGALLIVLKPCFWVVSEKVVVCAGVFLVLMGMMYVPCVIFRFFDNEYEKPTYNEFNKIENRCIKVSYFFDWNFKNGKVSNDYVVDFFVIRKNRYGKVENRNDIVYYNNLESEDGSTIFFSDCFSGCYGCGESSIAIDFSKVNDNIERIELAIKLFDAKKKRQDFSGLKNHCIVFYNVNGIKDCSVRDEIYVHKLEGSFLKDSDKLLICVFFRSNNGWDVSFNDLKIDGTMDEYLKNNRME